MQLSPQVTGVVLHIPTVGCDALLVRDRGQLTNALLLVSWSRIAKLKIRTRQAARAALAECWELLHGAQRIDLSTRPIVSAAICHGAKALTSSILTCTDEWGHLVLTFLPHPHVLGVVAAAAPLIDRQLRTRAQPSIVLAAARLGLIPRCAMQAATHANG